MQYCKEEGPPAYTHTPAAVCRASCSRLVRRPEHCVAGIRTLLSEPAEEWSSSDPGASGLLCRHHREMGMDVTGLPTEVH